MTMATPENTYECSFPATLEGMRAGMAFLDKICENPRLDVIFDEIASNIVRCSSAKDFSVKVVMDGGITLVISDGGTPFDPMTIADPDVSAPLEKRKVGGLGFFMVKKMSKSVEYRREGDRNVLTIVM